MENIFDNLFAITNNKKENTKVAKLEMEIEKLQLCLRMSQTANAQRKEAMDIMQARLEEQDALIKRLHKALKSQDIALAQAQETMKIQQERLAHIERIDIRMESIQQDQSQIMQFARMQTNGY